MNYSIMLIFILVCICFACDQSVTEEEPNQPQITVTSDDMEMTGQDDDVLITDEEKQAVALSVDVSGDEGSYNFNVELASPDTGCDQYADWWEVISPDSTLLYRRILTHSHVNEQPFKRRGGPVLINRDDEVFIRGHMNQEGYGSLVLHGSVAGGFVRDTISSTYASGLESTEPLPVDCAF